MKNIWIVLLLACSCQPPTDPGSEPNPAPGRWVDAPYWDISMTGTPEELIPDGITDTVNVSWIYDVPSSAKVVNAANVTYDIFNSEDDFYVIMPGDYSDLSRVDLKTSGSSQHPKVIYCPSGDCIFDAFYHRNTDNWIVAGITFTSENVIKHGTRFGNTTVCHGRGNVYHRCTWTNSSGIRIRGHWNTVQLCIGRDKPDVPTDTGMARIDAGHGEESRGNRIIGCEMVGLGDGAGVVWDDGSSGGTCPQTVIAFNLIPSSTERSFHPIYGYEITCSENGIDIKNGSIGNRPEDKSYLVGNISIGHRPTDQTCGGSGSMGSGWLLHRRSRNWGVYANISIDDTGAFEVKGYNDRPDAKDKVQAIDIRYNVILYPSPLVFDDSKEYEPLPRPVEKDGAAAQVLCLDCRFEQNIIVGARPDDPILSAPTVIVKDNYIYPPLKEGDEVEEILTAWGPILIPAIN